MCPRSTLNSSKALEGVHGVHVVPHSPFEFKEINQHGDISTSETTAIGANQLLLMQRAWQQRPSCLRPIQCSLHGDQHLLETVANVLTSLPFIALGLQTPRKNLNTTLYANSLIGVGVASSVYHSSRGKLRKYLRWADYTMIATATVCLSRALREENPKLLMVASALFLPIQPLMVSAVHTGMMEVAFAKRVVKDPKLRMAHNVHKMSSLLGGVLFIADDVFPQTPFLHAAWHLAAAVGFKMGCSHLNDLNMSSSSSTASSHPSTTAIRLPLIPNLKTPFPQSTSLLALCNYHANGTEQSRTEFMGSSRWNPTPEQLLALEDMYRQGTRTPSAEQIQHITAQLRRFGKIEGKNVFYWFQNHKARERQKRRREMETMNPEEKQHIHPANTGPDYKKDSGLRKTGYDVGQTKNWTPSSNCSKHTEESITIHRGAESGIGPHGWPPSDEKELHQRKSSLMISSTVDHMNATLQTPSSSSKIMIKDTITTTTSLETKFLLKENFNNVDETQKTLELFPVCRDEDGNNNVKPSTSKKLDTETLHIKTINAHHFTPSHQFIEFLPLKN
ncbi:hypothetical protein Ddye_030200 [Dipteronia dyeriana]|uniref:Homeobox domain-containing protein n=1 Tax=Dipteronia dyeriana TaxID=168575 RepID=A0AAD9TGY8_9ROSI|nr:hypothetical protein Ddye_030200 [Dipteronia dyeriana]